MLAYLTQFAAVNAIGGLEPHADWNQLMSSSALSIQHAYSVFESSTTFYPGENITFKFENGTEQTSPWRAIYNSPGETGPLATGGDFYNFFVLGLPPASLDIEDDMDSDVAVTETFTSNSSLTAPATPTSWSDSAYPQHPDVVQPELGDTGVLTGYFLHDSSTAVLSIPSFEGDGDSAASFSLTVAEFLRRSRDARLSRVVIDLQQNQGGSTLLAFDAFRQVKSAPPAMLESDADVRPQFFPTVEPFGGSRLRAHPMADALGNAFTSFYENQDMNYTFYSQLSASDWVSTDRINVRTGRNFTSWAEYFGPHEEHGDNFTTTVRGPPARLTVRDPPADRVIPSNGIIYRARFLMPKPWVSTFTAMASEP